MRRCRGELGSCLWLLIIGAKDWEPAERTIVRSCHKERTDKGRDKVGGRNRLKSFASFDPLFAFVNERPDGRTQTADGNFWFILKTPNAVYLPADAAFFYFMNTESKTEFSVRRWTWATFGGWFIGVFLIMMLSGLLDSLGIEGMQFYLGLGMGAGVGLAQWLVLRKYLTISALWIAVSALTMGAPTVIFDLMPTGSVPYKLAFGVVLGALTQGLSPVSDVEIPFGKCVSLDHQQFPRLDIGGADGLPRGLNHEDQGYRLFESCDGGGQFADHPRRRCRPRVDHRVFDEKDS